MNRRVNLAIVFALVFLAGHLGLNLRTASGGFVDSVGKSADSSGKYVEKKSGSRSDTKKFPIHRLAEPGIKVQMPVAYKIVEKNKTTLKAADKAAGVNVAFHFTPMKSDAGLNKYRDEKKASKDAFKAGKLVRWKERSINDVPGMETMKGSDRNGPKTYQWSGFDSSRNRYIVLTADFGPKKYDGDNAAQFDAMVQSIAWDYKKK